MAELEAQEERGFNLLPPEKDKEGVGTAVMQILEELLADRHALGLPQKWLKYYEYTRNKHWRRPTTKETPLLEANLMYRHRSQTVNFLTDNQPTFNVSQVSGDPKESRDVLDKLHHQTAYWWNETEQQGIFELSVNGGETYGPATEKVIFNPDLEAGLGEVETLALDPFQYGVFPFKEADNQKALANLHFYTVPTIQLRQDFPESASEIKSDDETIKELAIDERRQLAGGPNKDRSLLQRAVNTITQLFNRGTREGHSMAEESLLIEAWVKDKTMEDVPGIDLQGELIPLTELTEEEQAFAVEDNVPNVEIERPKYPGFIRRVQVCNMGELVLTDMPNPSINPDLPRRQTKDHYLFDKFPFTRTSSIKDASDPNGVNDFEQIEGLQFQFNKALSQLTNIKDKKSRQKVVNPKTSGVTNKQFTNATGIINPTNEIAAQGISILESPDFNQDYYQYLDLIKGLFFLIVGSLELENAQVAGGGSLAYKAIAALLEEIARMMRGKDRNYGFLIRERGRMYVSLIQNFYTEERWFTFKDKQGNEQSDSLRGTEITIPSKLTVVRGSTLPTSLVQRREEAIELAKLGVFGVLGRDGFASKHVLESMDYPGVNDIVKDIDQGTVGGIMEKFKLVDTPDELLEYFEQVAGMDDKTLGDAIDKELFPPFPVIAQSIQQPDQPSPQEQVFQIEMGLKQAELDKENAEVEKIKAQAESEAAKTQKMAADARAAEAKAEVEIAKIENENEKIKLEQPKMQSEVALNEAKIQTEQAKQEQVREGIEFDRKMVKVKQALAAQDVLHRKLEVIHFRKLNIDNQGDKQRKVSKPGGTSSATKAGGGAFTGIRGVDSDNKV